MPKAATHLPAANMEPVRIGASGIPTFRGKEKEATKKKKKKT